MFCSGCSCRQTSDFITHCTTSDGKRTFTSDVPDNACSLCQNYLKSLISGPPAPSVYKPLTTRTTYQNKPDRPKTLAEQNSTSPSRFTNSSKPKITGSISSSNISGHGTGSASIPAASTSNSIVPPPSSSPHSHSSSNDNNSSLPFGLPDTIMGISTPIIIAGGAVLGFILILVLK